MVQLLKYSLKFHDILEVVVIILANSACPISWEMFEKWLRYGRNTPNSGGSWRQTQCGEYIQQLSVFFRHSTKLWMLIWDMTRGWPSALSVLWAISQGHVRPQPRMYCHVQMELVSILCPWLTTCLYCYNCLIFWLSSVMHGVCLIFTYRVVSDSIPGSSRTII